MTTVRSTSLSGSSSVERPLVSVVTAAFNACDGVKQTVESVAGQSFRSVEHIVIDGGSCDGSVEFLRSRGDQVRWISEPDQGIANALNKGIAMARGEYVLVLQAEDRFVDNDSLAHAVPHLRHGTDIVGCGILFETGGGLRHQTSRGFGPRTRLHPPFLHQGAFCRAALFDRIGCFDEKLRIAMDYEFFVRAYVEGASFRLVSDPVAIMPDTGVSSRLDWKSLKARLDENRQIHFRHAGSPLMRALYHAYWLAYPPFKRIRSHFGRSNLTADPRLKEPAHDRT